MEVGKLERKPPAGAMQSLLRTRKQTLTSGFRGGYCGDSHRKVAVTAVSLALSTNRFLAAAMILSNRFLLVFLLLVTAQMLGQDGQLLH